MSRFTRGKRTIAVFVVALAALAVGVSVAVAKSGPSQTKVHFEVINSFGGFPCGVPALTKHEVGKGTVSAEKGGPVKIVAQFRGIESSKYQVLLIDGACTAVLADLGTFSVGDDGDTCNTSISGLTSTHCGEGTFKAKFSPATFPAGSAHQSFSLLALSIDPGTATAILSTIFKVGGQ